MFLAASTAKGQLEFKEHEAGEKGVHKISFSLAQVYFQEGKSGEIRNTFVPAYTLNYDYMLTSRWSLGMHNDIPLQDIEKEDGLEPFALSASERPVATKLIGAYHTRKHFGFLFGIGDEIAHKESFFITSAGAEYEFHLKGSWQLGAELAYDYKIHTADTWTMGIGISKMLSLHHHKG